MGDFNGSNYDDAFMGKLVSFVAGDEFQTMFEQFFLTHATVFTNDEEHKLEYYTLYQEFHGLFERQLEGFCDELGMSQPEFMRKCRECQSADPKSEHYINILMSSVEYDTFVKLMRIMRPVAERKKQSAADAKGSDLRDDSGRKAPAASKGGDDYDIEGDDYANSGSRYRADEKVTDGDRSPSGSKGVASSKGEK